MLSRSAYAANETVLDRFSALVSETRLVWTVSGEDGLARVPSRTKGGREAVLAWSSSSAAERWAGTVARRPRLNPIMLENFLGHVLPRLRELNRLVAPDWTADPMHPQYEPAEIARQLGSGSIEAFLAAATTRRTVYILEDDLGPAFAAAAGASHRLVLPVWSTREGAERQVKGFWAEMMISAIDLDAFVAKTLPWVAGIGRTVSPEYGLGGVPMDIGALDLAGRLMRQTTQRRFA